MGHWSSAKQETFIIRFNRLFFPILQFIHDFFSDWYSTDPNFLWDAFSNCNYVNSTIRIKIFHDLISNSFIIRHVKSKYHNFILAYRILNNNRLLSKKVYLMMIPKSSIKNIHNRNTFLHIKFCDSIHHTKLYWCITPWRVFLTCLIKNFFETSFLCKIASIQEAIFIQKECIHSKLGRKCEVWP